MVDAVFVGGGPHRRHLPRGRIHLERDLCRIADGKREVVGQRPLGVERDRGPSLRREVLDNIAPLIARALAVGLGVPSHEDITRANRHRQRILDVIGGCYILDRPCSFPLRTECNRVGDRNPVGIKGAPYRKPISRVVGALTCNGVHAVVAGAFSFRMPVVAVEFIAQARWQSEGRQVPTRPDNRILGARVVCALRV